MTDKRESIFELFPIANIRDNYIEYENQMKTYFYKIESYIDTDWLNNYKLNEHIDKLALKFSEISEDYVLSLNIIGNNISQKVNNKIEHFKSINNNNFILNYLEDKANSLSKKKKITYILGITHINNNFNKDDFYFLNDPENKIAATMLNETEIFHYLYNKFNPDRYNDDLSREPANRKELMDPTISINSLLLESYIQEEDTHMVIGDKYVAQNIVSGPPYIREGYFNISSLIEKLANFESDFSISIIIKNDSNSLARLNKRKGFGSGALLSYTSEMNGQIVKNISNFTEYLLEKNYQAVKTSILFTLYNDNKNKVIEEAKASVKINNWEGVTIIRNTYSQLPDFLGQIPGMYLQYKYNFIVSTKEMVTLLTLPKVNYDTITYFSKKPNIATNFDFADKNIGLPGGIVFAPPGRGKSAFLNYLFLNYLVQNPDMMSLIIDFGGSYKSLVKLLKMDSITYSNFVIDEETYYNPLDLEFGKEITIDLIIRKINVLNNFFYEAIGLTESEETLLSVGLEETYTKILLGPENLRKKFKEAEEEKTIPFINQYNNSNYTDKTMFFRAMPNIMDFIKVISSSQKIKTMFSEEELKNFSNKIDLFLKSSRGKIFSKNSTTYFLNTNLIVDLKNVAQTDEKMLNIVLVYLLQSKLLTFTDPEHNEKKKVLFVDEYDQFRSRSDFISKISKTVFKTGRKENIHQYLVSQNVTDFDKDMFNVCAHLISFNPNTLKELQELHAITGFPKEELQILIDGIKTVKGKYSEMAVFTNNDKKERTFLRFETSPFEYYSFITSSPEERTLRDKMIEKHNGDVKKAIEEIISLNKN